jgi:UDP-glucose 4-epimerase
MKVIVTGGAGFIGSHIVDGCLAAGYDVAVVDDLSTGDLERLNPKAAFWKVDIRSAELEKVIAKEKPEIACHQAARANVRESMEKPLLYADVNVLGSLNLLECCRKHGVRKVVYASTGGAAYGEPQHLPVTEDHPVNPLDPYGASKHHVEHYLFLYRHSFGLDYTVLRYPNVFGERQDPEGEAGVVAIFGRQMLLGMQPVINGSGLQERDFVHVSDVVKANLLAFDRASGRILNIGSGVGTSVNTIYQGLAGLTGFKGQPLHGPAKQGEVNRIFLDARRARYELGWSPSMPLEEGLRRTVDFLKAGCENTSNASFVR